MVLHELTQETCYVISHIHCDKPNFTTKENDINPLPVQFKSLLPGQEG
jgi:hypothetical protein